MNESKESIFVGIGTILNSKIPQTNKKAIFSSGFGYGKLPNIDKSFKFYCVRGPLTAEKLKLDKKVAVTDGAALYAKLYNKRISKKDYKFSFMPHCTTAKSEDWKQVCNNLEINYIDPQNNNEIIFQELQKSEILITEAMHGAIISDTLRIPWIPVTTSSEINSFKWNDWCQSMNLNYAPFTFC